VHSREGLRDGGLRHGAADPEVLARFKSFGSRPMMTDSKEFGDFIASEIKKWTTVVDAAHLRQK